MTAAGTGDAVVASPGDIPDPEAAAAVLAEVFGGDAAAFLEQLASDPDRVVLDAGARRHDAARPSRRRSRTAGSKG